MILTNSDVEKTYEVPEVLEQVINNKLKSLDNKIDEIGLKETVVSVFCMRVAFDIFLRALSMSNNNKPVEELLGLKEVPNPQEGDNNE